MRIIASLFLISMLSSCFIISIEINGNDYSDLSPQDKTRIKDFNQLSSFVYDKNYYELDSTNLENVINSHELVWIHTWRPFCGAKECQYIAPFQSTAENNSTKLYMLSETYELKKIDQIVKQSNFSLPVFILSNQYYGSKIDKSDVAFQEDIIGKKVKSRKLELCTDYLFKNGKLIFQDRNLIDSLEIVLKRN